MAAQEQYWRRALLWCGVTILAGIVAQHMWLDWRTQGSTLGLVLFGAIAGGAFVAVEINGVLALLDNHWKKISATPLAPEKAPAEDPASDDDVDEKRIETETAAPEGEHGP